MVQEFGEWDEQVMRNPKSLEPGLGAGGPAYCKERRRLTYSQTSLSPT